jgi:putative spermidine/putrescine transport system permease protein
VPLGATLAFGLSNGKSIGFSTYAQIFSDHDFSQTITISFELSLATTLLTVILVTPTAYWLQIRLPRARPIMDFLALVPFAVPAIVMAFGLVEVYGTPNTLISVLSLGLVPLLSSPALNIVNTAPTTYSILMCPACIQLKYSLLLREKTRGLRRLSRTCHLD